jgi:hypothetical protein
MVSGLKSSTNYDVTFFAINEADGTRLESSTRNTATLETLQEAPQTPPMLTGVTSSFANSMTVSISPPSDGSLASVDQVRYEIQYHQVDTTLSDGTSVPAAAFEDAKIPFKLDNIVNPGNLIAPFAVEVGGLHPSVAYRFRVKLYGVANQERFDADAFSNELEGTTLESGEYFELLFSQSFHYSD